MNLSEINNFLQEKIKIENHYDNFNSTKNKFFVCTHDIWCLDALIAILLFLKKLEKKINYILSDGIVKIYFLKSKFLIINKNLLYFLNYGG